MNISTSVIIPAYNEEKNLLSAVYDIIREIKKYTTDYEIIIIDDGSTDNTGKIADILSQKNNKIKIIHHDKNLGFGMAFRSGLKKASKLYFLQFHADNDTSAKSIVNMIKYIGKADMVISYNDNMNNRPFFRRLLSRTFVIGMNAIFGMNLKYYNGCFVCQTKRIQKLRFQSEGFAIYCESKVKLIRTGARFIEVPFIHLGRKYGKSKALNIKNFLDALKTVLSLLIFKES